MVVLPIELSDFYSGFGTDTGGGGNSLWMGHLDVGDGGLRVAVRAFAIRRATEAGDSAASGAARYGGACGGRPMIAFALRAMLE